MRSSNPVLTGRGFARINPDVLDGREGSPQEVRSLETRPNSAPMSIDDVIIKTAGLFAVLVVVGAVAWRLANPALALVGVFGCFLFNRLEIFCEQI